MWVTGVYIILQFGHFSWNLIDHLTLSWAMSVDYVSVENHVLIENVKRVVEFIDVTELGLVSIIMIATAF